MVDMEKISDILAKNIQKSGIKRQVDAARAVEYFQEIITDIWGASVAKKCQGLYVKDRALLVACVSSVIAQEVQLRQRIVITRLNDRLGGAVVDALRFIS